MWHRIATTNDVTEHLEEAAEQTLEVLGRSYCSNNGVSG
jgi:uncharacterized protein YbbK (DUF523 family)